MTTNTSQLTLYKETRTITSSSNEFIENKKLNMRYYIKKEMQNK